VLRVITRTLRVSSGAGTNVEVGCTGPVRKWAIFFGRAPSLVWLQKSTISRFGECFRDGQYSLVSFFLAVLLLTVPPVPSHL